MVVKIPLFMKSLLSLFYFSFLFSLFSCAQLETANLDLALPYLVQQPTEKTTHSPVIILMHGYGSNEKDLFELRNYFPKNFIVVAVRAPYSLSRPNAYQWYEMGKSDGHHSGKKEDVEHSKQLVLKFITQVTQKYKADPTQVYLSGFSQGAMMSYAVGLTNPGQLKGIAPLSGMIMDFLHKDIKADALKKLKIFISNGTADERISFTDGKASYDYLVSLGLKPEFHQYEGMGHQISKDVINDLINWLNK